MKSAAALVNVRISHPLTFACAATFLGAAGTLASYLPARHSRWPRRPVRRPRYRPQL